MPQVEDADELVDRRRSSPSRRRSRTVSSSPPTASWMIARASSRSRVVCRPGAAGLGVGVRVAGQHLVADEVLDEGQRPAAGGVVGVGDPARAVGPVHHLVVADDRLADAAPAAAGSGRSGSRGGTGSSSLGHASSVRATMAPRSRPVRRCARGHRTGGARAAGGRQRRRCPTARGSRSSGTTRSTSCRYVDVRLHDVLRVRRRRRPSGSCSTSTTKGRAVVSNGSREEMERDVDGHARLRAVGHDAEGRLTWAVRRASAGRPRQACVLRLRRRSSDAAPALAASSS